ncbi:MAG: TolC family outer membrane protein [Paracoccaceae bacterium]
MMRKFWAVLAIGIFNFAPVAVQAETLTDALISAYRASHLLEQNQAVLRAADEDVADAVGQLLPVLQFTANAGVTRTDSPGVAADLISKPITLQLSASIPIFDFGRGALNVDIKNELVLASQQSLVNVEQQVLLDAVSAYVNMGLQTELVAAQESNVRLITQDLRAAQDRFDVGEVTRTDVALAQAQLAAANASLASAQGDYNIARERYNAAIGHYPTKLAPLPKSPVTARSLEEARALALRTHPVIQQSQHQAKAADIGVALAKAQMSPNVTGSVALQQGINSDNLGLGTVTKSVGLQMTQTLYAGGRLSSGFRQAIAQSQSAHAGLLQTGVKVSEAVGGAWSNILVANASIIAGSEQIRAAQAAYDGVKEEAALGSRTTLDVLDAEQNLLSAKSARLTATANFYIGQYQLLSTMGLLTARHLHLGVPIFDPQAYYNAVKTAPATSAQGAKLDRILKSLGK